jgi:GAF domain-containing protein
VRNLAQALGTAGAWVTEYLPDQNRLRALSFWWSGAYVEGYEYALEDTPCEQVITRKCLTHFPEKIVTLFPRDPDLGRFGAVSYIGHPILDVAGEVLGHLAVMDTKPLPRSTRMITLVEIFAARAAAEFRRLEAEERLRGRERLLARLFETATDASWCWTGSSR